MSWRIHRVWSREQSLDVPRYRPRPDDPVALRWGALACASAATPVAVHRLELERGSRARASAICYLLRGLDLTRFMGARASELHARLGRVGLRPLELDVAYLETPFLNRSGLVCAEHTGAQESAELLARATTSLREAGQRAGLDLLCVKTNADPRQSAVLDTLGLSPLPFIDNTRLELPASADYSAWVAARSKRMRRHIRYDQRQLHRAGATLEIVETLAPHAARCHALFEATRRRVEVERAQTPMPMYPGPELFARFDELPRGSRWAVLIRDAQRELIGFALLLREGDTLLLKTVGFDHAAANPARAYTNAFYAGIRHAIALGCRAVDLGPTGYALKQRLGAQRSPSSYHVHFFRPLLKPLGPLLRARFSTPAPAAPHDRPGAPA